jgi:hypothetical protein
MCINWLVAWKSQLVFHAASVAAVQVVHDWPAIIISTSAD